MQSSIGFVYGGVFGIGDQRFFDVVAGYLFDVSVGGGEEIAVRHVLGCHHGCKTTYIPTLQQHSRQLFGLRQRFILNGLFHNLTGIIIQTFTCVGLVDTVSVTHFLAQDLL